jgi:type I restriction enzyme S subunit
MNVWKECALGDVVTFQRGFDITQAEQLVGVYPVVSSSGTKSFHSEYKVKGPGVIIGRKGTLGTVFFLETDYWPHDTTLFVKDFHGNHPRFVYYFLKEFEFQNYDVGSSNPTLNRNHIHLLPCVLPPLPEQRAIASVLSSLDDKIDLLNRQNKTLEAMAETLFRQWFVEEAASNEMTTLGEFASNVRQNARVEDLGKFNHYVGLEHIPRKCVTLSSWGNPGELASNKSIFLKNDILFGKLRSYFHKVVFAPIDGVCSTDILVIRPRKDEWFAFCLFVFFSQDVVDHSDLGSGGTRMPRTNWEILSSYQIRRPEDHATVEFDKIVRPMINRMSSNVSQIQNLVKLRDVLLPKLMSGEVDVSK